MSPPSRCRIHAPPGRAAGVPGSYAEAGWCGGRCAALRLACPRPCLRASAQTRGPRRLPGFGPFQSCLSAAAASAADATGPRRHVLVVSTALRVGRVRRWVREAGGRGGNSQLPTQAAQETRFASTEIATFRAGLSLKFGSDGVGGGNGGQGSAAPSAPDKVGAGYSEQGRPVVEALQTPICCAPSISAQPF